MHKHKLGCAKKNARNIVHRGLFITLIQKLKSILLSYRSSSEAASVAMHPAEGDDDHVVIAVILHS